MATLKKFIKWDDQPLGREADTVIARRAGCTAAAVYCARKARGIRALHPQRPRCDPRAFLEELDGTQSDKAIAERHGLHWQQVRNARVKFGKPCKRLDWDKMPLGSVPDIELARQYGVDNKVVAAARWTRGIGSWARNGEPVMCPCGEMFVPFMRTARFCSNKCRQYHSVLMTEGMDRAAADCAVAVAAYRRTMKGRG